MAMQAAAFINAEDVLEKQLEKSINKLEESKGMAKCEAHNALVENAILQTQTLMIGVSYLRSPLIKAITLILTLGGTASIAMLLKVALAMMTGSAE